MIRPQRHKLHQSYCQSTQTVKAKSYRSESCERLPNRKTEEASICLNCTKEKCTGTNKCFEKTKRGE